MHIDDGDGEDGINDDDLVLGEKKGVMTKQTHGLKKETAQLVENTYSQVPNKPACLLNYLEVFFHPALLIIFQPFSYPAL